MPDRRTLLVSAAAAGLAPLSRAFAQPSPDQPSPAAPTSAEGVKLNALFDAFMQENLRRSPETATQLGLDKGAMAAAKRKLDDRSLAGAAEDKRRNADQLRRLRTINRAALTGMDAVNYDTVFYVDALQDEANRAFDYGGSGAGQPYVISQLTGAVNSLPDFLDSQHTIETKADADAYLARLEAFGPALDQETEQARHDAGLGVIPPDFILDRTLGLMTKQRATPIAQSVLVDSVVRRTKEKGIAGDYGAPATRLVNERVYPALDRQITLLQGFRAKAVHTAGVGRLPHGAEYYRLSLKQSVTTDISPAEVHRTGLELVGALSAKIDTILKAQGLSQGTVGARLRGLYDDPRFRYPNTDEGKAKLIADLNLKVAAIRTKLPQYFGVLPKANVEIHRVPKYIEAGQPGGYYNSPALDGSRPGIYYINLRDTAEVPSWTLPTLTFHESIPGHHLQGSIANESPLPLIRKVIGFNAYLEGWALYAEQLAVEMGMYDNDPFGRVGQLHDALFRAVRLVLDSGLHSMDWSREQAVKYYVDNLGDQEASAVTEVERYCVWPGQASSYMIGKLDFLRQRDMAKAALGSRFDVRGFHDAALTSGAMPLTVMDQVLAAWTASRRA